MDTKKRKERDLVGYHLYTSVVKGQSERDRAAKERAVQTSLLPFLTTRSKSEAFSGVRQANIASMPSWITPL